MTKMSAAEMIRKYKIHLGPQGKIAIANTPEARKNFETIKAAKPEIVAELKRQKEAAEAAEAEAKELERQNIISGATLIEVSWHDGEYLQGYAVYGLAAELLREIGAAERVAGWGTKVGSDMIKKLGEGFTYAQAAEYMRPANDAKAMAAAQKAADLQAKYDEARVTGKPVLIKTYMADCNDPREDCSFDTVDEYAMPDGSKKISRQHCW